jgi:site-specific DNA-cytosine methylase
MTTPPFYIALENVVGFESSECCQQWLSVLTSLHYEIEQFHLTPLQFGIPNARPRYYCIAWKKQEKENENGSIGSIVLQTSLTDKKESMDQPLFPMKSVSEYLMSDSTASNSDLVSLQKALLLRYSVFSPPIISLSLSLSHRRIC